MRCSSAAPTVTVRSRMPGSEAGCARRGRRRATPSKLAPVQQPQIALAAEPPRSASHSSSLATQPDGNAALLTKSARVLGPTAARRRRVESPLAAGDVQRDELRHRAGEADAVEHAGVGRIGQDDLVARIGEDEERVEHRVALAAGDDDLARPVVARAAAALDRRGDRLLELVAAGERQPAVRLVAPDCGACRLDRRRRRRHVGVEVLEAQHLRVVTRRRRDAVDVEPGDLLQTLDAHTGAPGFEPGITGPKPVALPLGHAPQARQSTNESLTRGCGRRATASAAPAARRRRSGR